MSAAVEAPEEPAEAGAALAQTHVWPGLVMATVAVATPFLAYFANLGFAIVIGVAGLVSLPLLYARRKPNLGFALLAALVVWAAISMQWSVAAPVHPIFAHHKAGEDLTALKLALELAFYGAFVVASQAMSRVAGARALAILTVGLAAMVVVFLGDAVFQAPLYQAARRAIGKPTDLGRELRDLSRSAYVLAVLFWPVALRFEGLRARVAAAAVVVAALVGSYIVNADAPYAALAVSGLMFAAVRYFGRPAILVLLIGVMLYFLAAPLVIVVLDQTQLLHPAAGDIRMQSWAIRLDIWRFAAARIHERPYFGWGLDAARTFSPNIPLHTHDGAMQLWLELGGVGAVLGCLFWSWIVTRIDRVEAIDRPLAAAMSAAACAYLTLGAISFGIWQEWWLAVGALTAAVCIALAKARGISFPLVQKMADEAHSDEQAISLDAPSVS